jgi:hypothetical protein
MTNVLGTIVTIIVHTPLWVWGLYAALLFLGLQRTRDSSVPLWRMLILPIAVALLAISSVIGTSLEGLAAATVGLLVGSGLGWSLEPKDATRRLPDGKLWQRGEWLTLVQIALTLLVRYVTNVVAAMAPVLGANPIWHVSTLLVTALLSGVFLGRVAAKLRIYLAVPAGSPAQIVETGTV